MTVGCFFVCCARGSLLGEGCGSRRGRLFDRRSIRWCARLPLPLPLPLRTTVHAPPHRPSVCRSGTLVRRRGVGPASLGQCPPPRPSARHGLRRPFVFAARVRVRCRSLPPPHLRPLPLLAVGCCWLRAAGLWGALRKAPRREGVRNDRAETVGAAGSERWQRRRRAGEGGRNGLGSDKPRGDCCCCSLAH
jgi:hypothetical protein